MYKKLLVVLLSVALVASLFSGCAKTEVAQTSAQTETKTEVQSEIKSDESKVIMRTGQLMRMTATTNFHDNQYYPTYLYDDLNSLILAYNAGEIDSMFPFPLATAKYIAHHVEGVEVVQPQMTTGRISLSIGTLKENTEIYNLFDNAIKELTKNGTIDKLKEEYLDKYMRTYEDPTPIDMPILAGAKTVKMAITGDLPPIDFIDTDGRPAGFSVALLSEISKLTNTNIELVQVNSGARFSALKTNAVDAVFYNMKRKYDNEDHNKIYSPNVDIPDEISITEPYYESRICEVDSSKKLEELTAKKIIESKEITKDDEILHDGVLAYAATSEEEQNKNLSKLGWKLELKYFDNLNSMMLALKSGKIDSASLLPKSTAEYIKVRNDDIAIVDVQNEILPSVGYCMATLYDNKEVYNILNDTLKSIIKDGTLESIKKKYIDGFIKEKNEPEPIDMPHFDNAKTIKMAVTGDLPPFDFVSVDGRPAGYNVALLSEIANRAKVNIELVTMDEKAKVTALATKNVDAVFWFAGFLTDWTGYVYDCPKEVILTECYYKDESSRIVIKK